MKRAFFTVLLPLLLVVIFVWVILITIKVEPFTHSPVKSLKTPQQADAAYGYPVGEKQIIPAYSQKLSVIDPFTRISTPTAHHFQQPVSQGEVEAVADGIVVFSGNAEKKWGQTTVLAHKLTDGRYVLTYYGNLAAALHSQGKILARGQRVGKSAALKFQFLESDGVVFDKPESAQEQWMAFRKNYNKQRTEELGKAPLKILLEEQQSSELQRVKYSGF